MEKALHLPWRAKGHSQHERMGLGNPASMSARQVIAVVNQKGGVGKTTTSVNLAASVAAAEKRTLLVDLDPQGNASSGVGVRPGTCKLSVYDAMIGQAPLKDTILPTEVPHLFLAPATQDLVAAELELVDADDRATRLKSLLDPVRGDYDHIFLDCPPSLGLLTLNALVAADRVLVPLQCEYYALEGVAMITRILNQVRETGINPGLELLGVVMTMYDGRTKLAQNVVSEVRQHFGTLAFETMIPRTTRIAEAPSFGKPVTVYDPYSAGSSAYEVLAGEVANRLGL